MRIAILTLGTRGDVQPYVVLGKALKQRGHFVTLATAKNFEALVTSYDIDFRPVEADFQAVLNSAEGKKMMKGNPFAIKRNLNSWLYPLISNSLLTFYKIAQESDIVLYHVKTLADSFADQFPEKMIRASLLPIVEPTTAFANPAFSGLPIPQFLNRVSYSFANLSFKLLSKPIGLFRSEVGLSKKFKIPAVKNIYGLSPSFLPLPTDYSPNSSFNGFWFDESEEELSPDINTFIQSGEPPLLVTFGSMPFKSKFDLQTAILKLTDTLDIRIFVVKGWGLDQTSRLEGNPMVKVVEGAPFDKLFPLVKAIVHHGGIGTTAACLRAGKPFMICPILYPIGDQKFWGDQAFTKGVAIKPIPLSRMTESKFVENIKDLLSNELLYTEAKNLKQLIDQEEGVTRTIEQIENVISNIYE